MCCCSGKNSVKRCIVTFSLGFGCYHRDFLSRGFWICGFRGLWLSRLSASENKRPRIGGMPHRLRHIGLRPLPKLVGSLLQVP